MPQDDHYDLIGNPAIKESLLKDRVKTKKQRRTSASKKRKGIEAKVEIEAILASSVEFPWRVWQTKEGPWIGVNDVLRLTVQEDDRDQLISTMEDTQNEFLESMWEAYFA